MNVARLCGLPNGQPHQTCRTAPPNPTFYKRPRNIPAQYLGALVPQGSAPEPARHRIAHYPEHGLCPRERRKPLNKPHPAIVQQAIDHGISIVLEYPGTRCLAISLSISLFVHHHQPWLLLVEREAHVVEKHTLHRGGCVCSHQARCCLASVSLAEKGWTARHGLRHDGLAMRYTVLPAVPPGR
jgi:hypothetical protein